MKFERILDNGRLWAVMYDENNVNILEKVFEQWNDYERQKGNTILIPPGCGYMPLDLSLADTSSPAEQLN